MRSSFRFSRKSTLALVFAAPLAVVASCSVGELDLTGKQCPCAGGYVCDVPSNTCVRGLSVDSGAPNVADTGVNDALFEPDRNALALLNVTGLAPSWTTPGMARWDWTVEGKAADFLSYSVVTSEDANDILNGTAKVLGKIDQPELEQFDSRGKKESGPAAIWTLTNMRANTALFMRVEVKDKSGQVNTSAIVSAKAPPGAQAGKAAFDGNEDVGVKGNPTGEFDYRPNARQYVFTTSCAPAAPFCFKRADLVGLTIDLSKPNGFGQAEFDRAFLDVKLDGNVAQSSLDTFVGIEPGDGGCAGITECRYGFQGWTQSTSAGESMSTVQVPLSRLMNGAGATLTLAILQQKNFKISAFGFHGTWKQGSVLRLIEARIRW